MYAVRTDRAECARAVCIGGGGGCAAWSCPGRAPGARCCRAACVETYQAPPCRGARCRPKSACAGINTRSSSFIRPPCMPRGHPGRFLMRACRACQARTSTHKHDCAKVICLCQTGALSCSNRGQTDPHGFVVPKPAAAPPMAAGYGRSRVDIGRCEAQGGAPRPSPQPTGPRGPLGPCPAGLAPWLGGRAGAQTASDSAPGWGGGHGQRLPCVAKWGGYMPHPRDESRVGWPQHPVGPPGVMWGA